MLKIDDVPDEYIKVHSGLGEAKPAHLMIMPVDFEGHIVAVIELASFQPFENTHETLLVEASKQLGVTLNRIEKHMQIQELLNESQTANEELQTQSEELQQQQEELRSINDELEAQNKANEQKTLELEAIRNELEENTRQLEMNSKYKSEFLANMSHELRTPLNSLLILSKMLIDNPENNLTDKQLQFAKTIHTSGSELLELISDILDLSKVESGKMDLTLNDVTIDDIIVYLNQHFEPVAEQKSIDFIVTKDEETPETLLTDEQKLRQILKNLLSNAFKFTQQGHVEFHVQSGQLKDQSMMIFSIKDTGIGIPEEKKKYIFEAFRQADGTTNRKYGGYTQHIKKLKVSDNQRFLVYEDGSPFFGLGDTAWELFHKLNREESELYLRNRAERKFNVIQAVALAELDGLTTPNAYGRVPLKQNQNGQFEPTLPDIEDGVYDYWDHVDYIIDLAASLNIYIALLPTWGDKYNVLWGKGPVIFNPDNAKLFGEWLAHRYRQKSNVIWVLGGDRPLTEMLHFQINQGLAQGIRNVVGDQQLITFHPSGDSSSSLYVHHEEWLDFNMIQSGHGSEKQTNYLRVQRDYEKVPAKPTFDAEPCYEDHPIGFKAENGYFDEYDVRKAAYYAVFSGGFGHTYGHHSVWCMSSGESSSLEFTGPGSYVLMNWKEAIMKPGAAQMQHLRSLIESKSFLDRIPDQSLIVNNGTGSNYAVATRGADYILVYIPNGVGVEIKLGIIQGESLEASWYNPRDGASEEIGKYKNTDVQYFKSPSSGRGYDWVLVLEQA